MTYLFDVQDAVEYGDRAAILIYNLKFWIRKNHVDGRNQHEIQLPNGKTEVRTWTYLRREHRRRLFPFWSERQFYLVIDKLVMRGVLLASDRFNKMPQDRTKWLAFVDQDRILELPDNSHYREKGAIHQNVNCNLLNDELQSTDRGTAIDENVGAIPDDKPDTKPFGNREDDKLSSSSLEESLRRVGEECGIYLDENKKLRALYKELGETEFIEFLVYVTNQVKPEFERRNKIKNPNATLESYTMFALGTKDKQQVLPMQFWYDKKERAEKQERQARLSVEVFCPVCRNSAPRRRWTNGQCPTCWFKDRDRDNPEAIEKHRKLAIQKELIQADEVSA